MKKTFCFLFMAVGLLCSACSDDEEYNPDTAQSNYQPADSGQRVATVYTTNTVDGRDYSWKHNFSYDAQGRIKEVNSVIKHHRAWSSITGTGGYRECNITSNAKYYYYGEELKIVYSVNKVYPEYSSWNTSYTYTDAGKLNDDGYICYYSTDLFSFEYEYNMGNMLAAYFNGVSIKLLRDGRGNVNGHKYSGYDTSGNDSISTRSGRYEYTSVRNNTNFDFSAYFGYWEHERYIEAMAVWPYASYQLAAFGFFGSVSKYLPLYETSTAGDENAVISPWEFKDGLPVKYTSPDGRVTEITYTD